MLYLYLGNDEGAKRKDIYERISSFVENGRECLVLVPEIRSHFEERALLENCGDAAGFWAEVTTFTKLASKILTDAGKPVRSLDAAGRVLVMKKALSSVSGALTYYKRASSFSPGTLKKLLAVCDEFSDSGVEADELLRADTVSDKIRDLAKIYIAYQSLLGSSRMDARETLRRAAQSVRDSETLSGISIFILGFNGFTAREREMICALCGRTEITVCLTTSPESGLFDRQLRAAEDLKRKCTPCESRLFSSDGGGVFLPFAQSLLSYGSGIAPDGVHIIRAHDEREESELCVALCRKLALSGMRFRDITIVCEKPGEYSELLQSYGEKYGVPVFSGEKESISHLAPVSSVLAALSAAAGSMEREPFCAWLKSPYSTIPRTDAERLENYALTWRIAGSRWLDTWEQPEDGYRGGPDPEGLGTLNEIRQRAVLSLEYLRQALKTCGTGADFAGALTDFLDKTGYSDKTLELCLALDARGLGLQSSRFSQSHDALYNTLGQFSDIMGEQSMDKKEFYDLFTLALSQCSVSAIPPSLDNVLLTSYSRAIIDGKKAVFILGAEEGSFPPGALEQGILTDADRIALEGEGVILTKSLREAGERAEHDLFTVLSGAGERLYISYPVFDVMGGEKRKSFLINRAEDMLAPESIADAGVMLESLRFSAQVPAFEQACAMGRDSCKSYFDAFPEKSELYDEIMFRARNPFDVIRDPELIRSLYGDTVRLSASSIEKYNQCPFSYFLDHGLRLKKVEAAEFEAPQIGTLVHSVVENAVRDCVMGLGDIEELAGKYAESYLTSLPGYSEKNDRFLYAVERVKAGATAVAANVMSEIVSSGFEPRCFELSFGMKDGKLPPLTVSDGKISAEIRGQIDRLDVMQANGKSYLKICDYKTGKKEFHLSDILGGTNLQLYIYALAALKNSDAVAPGDVLPAAAVYIPAVMEPAKDSYGYTSDTARDMVKKDRLRMGVVIDEPEITRALGTETGDFYPKKTAKGFYMLGRDVFNMMLRRTEREVLKTAENILSGNIMPDPVEYSAGKCVCDWCDHKDVCFREPDAPARTLKNLPVKQVIERLGEAQDGI